MPFYNETNLILPLDAILLNNGYFYKKEKCSANHLTMNNENDDLIVITRASNGHYLYFNPIDDRDKGNIYSFCKNRGIKLNDLLDEKGKKGLDTTNLKHHINPSSLNDKAIESLNAFKELQALNESDNFFVLKRFISEESLKQFDKIKRDKFHNICIPSYTLDQCKDTSFINMCGYMNYLKSPIKKDKGFLKQLCYGKKGLEILKNKNTQSSDIKYILICESIIDSLSLFELGAFESQETLLCSTNGQVSPNHYKVFNFFAQSSNATFILGFDNDEKGKTFTQKILEALKDKQCIVKIPCLKDFNDDLIARKLLSLDKDFTINELEKIVYTKLVEPITYFLDNKNIFLPESVKPNLNKALRAKTVLEFLQPKCENFISTQSKKNMNNILAKIQEYETQNLQKGR